MAESLKAPSSEYLLSLRTELGDLYLQQDQDIDDFRDQREMRTPAMSEADKDYVLVHVDPRDPDITEEAFQQTAILTLDRPRLSIVGGEGDTAQTVASKLEHFTEETLWQCGTRTPGQDTMNQVADATLNDGGGWAKMLWASDLWSTRYAIPRPNGTASNADYKSYDQATEDAKKQAGPPFVWAYVDPRSVYPQWSGGQLCEVLECSDMPMRFAFRRYRLSRDTDGNIVPEELGQATNTIEAARLANSSVQLYEHWDETWCFPASTLVESDGYLAGGYKRWYEGQLTTIRTARGYELSGTPNHPVMTERGWVPLGELKQGDHVISRTFRERLTSRNPDPENRQSPIGQVFGLLQRLGVGMRRMGSVQDFHGDGQEGQVDVVRTERVLWDWVDAALHQPREQVAFTLAHQLQRASVRFGLSEQGLAATRTTFECEARSQSLGVPLFRSPTTVTQQRRFAPTAHHHAAAFQTTADCPRGYAELESDLNRRLLEFDVAVDEVVHVERVFFAGHVYNLETSNSTYSANGIIVHNCTWAVCGSNYHQDRTGYIVKQYRHRYPFGVPYDYAPGLTMSHWRNRKVGWSIGKTKLHLVKYRQYLRAMHAQYVARDLLSPLVTYGDTPAGGIIGENGLAKEPQTSVHPGEILNLPPGRQLQRIQYPDAATLEKHMALIDGAIRDLESPRVTTLSGMEGAGFAISQVLQYTRTRIGPVRHGLEALLKGQTEKMWSLIREHSGEKVWVFYGGQGSTTASEQAKAEYIGFGPKDLERPMHIAWEVQAQLPTDEMIMARYAHERLAAGTWGKDEAVSYMGDNPDEIRRSIARDEIRQSDAYKKWLYNEVFMLAGRGDMLQKAQQAMARAQFGALPPPGLGPGGPPGQQPQPGVFEGGGPGLGGVPDLGALAAAPNGAGVGPPPYGQVVAGAQQPGGGGM